MSATADSNAAVAASDMNHDVSIFSQYGSHLEAVLEGTNPGATTDLKMVEMELWSDDDNDDDISTTSAISISADTAFAVDNDNDKENDIVVVIIDSDDEEEPKPPALKKQRLTPPLWNHNNPKMDAIRHDASLALALRLQAQEEEQAREELQQRKKREEEAMFKSQMGRAFLLVERILASIPQILNDSPPEVQQAAATGLLQTIGKDDMVFLATNIINMQETFQRQGKPIEIELAYHYTDQQRLRSIREGGLLTQKDFQKNSNNNTRAAMMAHGASFGNGVYVGANPYAFQAYGDTGLLVAILKGTTKHVGGKPIKVGPNTNTVIGNKFEKHGTELSQGMDEIILQDSSQVLPLIRYSADMIDTTSCELSHAGNAILYKFHTETQTLLDELFHNENPTPTLIDFVKPSPRSMAAIATVVATARQKNAAQAATSSKTSSSVGTGAANTNTGAVTAPTSASSLSTPAALALNWSVAALGSSRHAELKSVTYKAPAALAEPTTGNDNSDSHCWSRVKFLDGSSNICLLCHKSLRSGGRVVQLRACRHQFHQGCMEALCKSNQDAVCRAVQCPSCSVPTGEPQGNGPSGVMNVMHLANKCRGFTTSKSTGTFMIMYRFPAGKQKPYHPTLGKEYPAAQYKVYLPENEEGQRLLRRLKYAWSHGLVFTIGAAGKVVWSSIPHKTSLSGGGKTGFPDKNYFTKCHEALDALCVPGYCELLPNGTRS